MYDSSSAKARRGEMEIRTVVTLRMSDAIPPKAR